MKRTPTCKTSTLIVGGGLAGLSTALHCKNKSAILIEKEKEVGGTARSFHFNGFTFDMTGHLLHLHTPIGRSLIKTALKNNYQTCKRSTWIFSQNVYTRFPYQANTFGLPQQTIDSCLLGFLDAYLDHNQKNDKEIQKCNFRDWSYRFFGPGIAEKFMIPYNEKLYQTKAKNMNVDWCGPFVPMPNLEDVIHGALESQKKKFGYNATFLYPKRGGIQTLPMALSKKIRHLKTGIELRKCDWKNKTAKLSNGDIVKYSHLVNTMPLTKFLNTCSPLPKSVAKAKTTLKCVGVLCLNIGVKRSKISDKSWIYFPESKFPFYRVGFPMNFSRSTTPPGCSSMYIEVPLTWAKNKSKKQILQSVRNGLIEAGVLRKSDKLPVVQFLPIPFAYVVYDHKRTKSLNTINKFLKNNQIQSIGRYGGWKYSFMEEALLDGRTAAKKLSSSTK